MTDAERTRGRVGEVARTGLQCEAPVAGPIRTCIGCRGRDSRSTLLRVVVVTDERGLATAIPDPRRRVPGRGAWLHPDIACLESAERRRAFSRAFRRRVDGADAVRVHLEDGSGSTQYRPTVRTTAESGFDADEHPMSTQQ